MHHYFLHDCSLIVYRCTLRAGKKALVVRNGYFSYRWTDIFDQTGVASEVVVLKAGAYTRSLQSST